MRKVLLIAKRDYVAIVHTKAFLVGLVVAPLLFGGGFIGMTLLRDRPDTKEKRICVIDRTGLVAGAVIKALEEKSAKGQFDQSTGRQVKPRYVFEALKADDGDPNAERLALSDRVRRGELFAFLEIGPAALHPGTDAAASRVGYYTSAGGIDEMRSWLSGPLNEGLRRVRLAQLGVGEEHFDDLLGSVSLERLSLVSRDEKTGEIREANKKSEIESVVVPLAMMMLLGMIVMVGSAPMLSAVTEDKTQRVVEMLLGAATPFELMMGKVVAAVGVSLTSSVFYVVGGTLALQGMGMAGVVPFEILPWFYVYLIADVMMLCALAAGMGAACSSPRDAQNLAVLLLSPVMIPYFVLLPVLKQPNGVVSTAMSLFPPFTPMLMLLRQAIPGGVPPWQPWVGLVGVLAFTYAAVWVAARIFRVGILLQGKPPKLAELLRWAVRG